MRLLLALSKDLPKIWRADLTTQVERKQLLAFLIDKVILTRVSSDVIIEIKWRTGASTTVTTPLYLNRSQPSLIELIRKLAVNHTDQEIVDYLNTEGITPPRGKVFNVSSLRGLRYGHNIPIGSSGYSQNSSKAQRGDGRYRSQAVAQLLEVPAWVVVDMCKTGQLDGVQEKKGSCWWIRLLPEQIPSLKESLSAKRERVGSRTKN
jgi:hypothetical protein